MTFGKFKPGGPQGGESGKQWKDIPLDYLDWILSDKCSIATAKDMAGKELGRRAKAETAGGGTVDAEEVPLPLDDESHNRRMDRELDDDGYAP